MSRYKVTVYKVIKGKPRVVEVVVFDNYAVALEFYSRNKIASIQEV